MSQRIYSERAVLEEKRLFGEFGIFSFHLNNIPEAARPGQFVMLKTTDRPYPLLARPFSIFYAEENTLMLLVKKVGTTTGRMFEMKDGDYAYITGPLGNGFPDEFKDNVILVGGGSGIAPLNFYAKKYGFYRFLAGFRTEIKGLFNEIPKGVEVYTEDGSYGKKGFPTDYLREDENLIFACGPVPMLRALEKNKGNKIDRVFVSLESMMGCGTGLCAGCGVKKRNEEGYLRVCSHGPVFSLSRIAI